MWSINTTCEKRKRGRVNVWGGNNATPTYLSCMWLHLFFPSTRELAISAGKLIDHLYQLCAVLVARVEGVVTSDGLDKLKNCKISKEFLDVLFLWQQ